MRDEELQDLLNRAVSAVKEAPAVLGKDSGREAVSEDERDVKVAMDMAMDCHLIDSIRSFSDIPILTEESGEIEGKGEGWLWIVDPIDGSYNFNRDFPLYCISVGLWKGDEPVLGVIYDFVNDECFYGRVGGGAYLNGREFRVSGISEASKAVICTGFPVVGDYTEESVIRQFQEISRFRKVRMLGTAALMLAWVACGRADLYFEKHIRLWDIAAGLALIKAAGGDFRRVKTDRPYASHVHAANPALLKTLLPAID